MATLNTFQSGCRQACEVAKTATRNNKSLSGSNFYGEKFHQAVVAIAQSEAKLKPIIAACKLDDANASKLSEAITIIKSTTAKNARRTEALKQIQMLCQSVIVPSVENMRANPVPTTEQVLSLSVVQGTRTYLERIIMQANGCYEHQWFDGCSVMIRKFVEILIIEVYEANGKVDEIKDAGGNFFMLRDLVNRMLVQTHWNLGRETAKELPLIKSLGDRSAHNRRYVATKPDVDKVLHGLRAIADDLLHLAKFK